MLSWNGLCLDPLDPGSLAWHGARRADGSSVLRGMSG
jgi:hypothetical protein